MEFVPYSRFLGHFSFYLVCFSQWFYWFLSLSSFSVCVNFNNNSFKCIVGDFLLLKLLLYTSLFYKIVFLYFSNCVSRCVHFSYVMFIDKYIWKWLRPPVPKAPKYYPGFKLLWCVFAKPVYYALNTRKTTIDSPAMSIITLITLNNFTCSETFQLNNEIAVFHTDIYTITRNVLYFAIILLALITLTLPSVLNLNSHNLTVMPAWISTLCVS